MYTSLYYILKKGMKMKTAKLLLVTSAICGMVLFSGCATQKEIMVQEGHSLAYADGFDDGCHSGKKAGGNMFESFKKDENRFARHSKYSQGWSDGFRQCENEQEALDRQVRMNQEQQYLNEERKRNNQMDSYHLEQQAFKGIKYDPKLLNNLK